MSAVTGKGGTVSYDGGNVATINSWSIDVNSNMHDVTAFSTEAVVWREFASGLQGWSGAIDGTFDPSSTGQADLIANTITPTTGIPQSPKPPTAMIMSSRVSPSSAACAVS